MRTVNLHRIAGFTLIELMISIALSLLVLAGVLSAYLAGSQANIQMQQRVTLQQDARFALAGLTRELRMAGTFGCALPNSTTGVVTFNDYVTISDPWMHYDASETIGIYQEAASGSGWLKLTGGTESGFTPTGEVLIIQYGSGGTDVKATQDASGTKINSFSAVISPERSQISKAAVLALTNCQRLELFNNTGGVVGSDFTWAPTGGMTLPTVAENSQWTLMRLVTLAYAVGTYDGRQGLYLFELDEDGTWQGPKEIATGVTAMNVRFGIQTCKAGTDEDMDTRYYTSSQLSSTDWKKIGLIRLTLQMERAASNASGTIQRDYSTTVVVRRENLCMTQTAG